MKVLRTGLKMGGHMVNLVLTTLVVLLTSSCTVPQKDMPAKVVLKPVTFAHLPGWENDMLEEAQEVFRRSCGKFSAGPADRALGGAEGIFGTMADWKRVCEVLNRQTFVAVPARTYFEENFSPFLVMNNDNPEGLFTGYYEPLLKGSRTRSDRFSVPLLTRPADLVMVDLGEFRDELKGQRIAGRVVSGQLKPWEARAAIEQGVLSGKGLELVWLDDPVAAFVLHIQGSGRIALDDGTEMRVGYAAQNGHPYTAIGKVLADRGEIPKDQVT
ncbi:MAG: MltA domain-containing protein, partial [Pseudomonadota bacterium]|nr:MltA domain-containing protein [Pseudomonadota bacterium]